MEHIYIILKNIFIVKFEKKALLRDLIGNKILLISHIHINTDTHPFFSHCLLILERLCFCLNWFKFFIIFNIEKLLAKNRYFIR
jgi:hypothetical protein